MVDAAWHPDPLGRYELRYWDGEQWTEHVASGGQQGVDPEPIVVEQAGDDDEDAASDDAAADGAAADGAAADGGAADGVETEATEPVGASEWPATRAADDGGDAAADETHDATGDDVVAVVDGTTDEESPRADGGFAPPRAEDAITPTDVDSRTEATPDDGVPSGAAVLGVPVATGSSPGSPSSPGSGGPEADLGSDGIGGGLLDDDRYAERSGERVLLQNPRLLKVTLGRDVMIKRGSMVAYQGQMTFHAEGEGGGVGGLLKRAVATDNAKVARVSGGGELFLADDASEIHLLELGGGGLVVNGPNLLAFEEGMTFRTRSLGNAGIVAGGVFVTDVSGTGWVAVTCHGTPVRLTTDAPTYVDAGSAVAWSSSLQVDLNVQKLGFKSMRSGEIAQLAFRGTGFVLVQASEGPTVPSHSHG